MSAKKKIHLLGFLQHGFNSHAIGMWRYPKDKINWNWSGPEYWQHMARTMERGMFDGMFIADELAPYNNFQNSSDACVKWAVQCPTHEPSTIVPIITTATKYLGVGVTLSTAFEHPYSMVRRLSSLDHLSGGRVAWNVVSSYSRSEWDAYGAAMTPRAERYDRMEEYMEICYQLWDSWEPDAIIADRESGIFADPAKVHEVDYQGKYFSCKGRSFCYRSPQGRPVLWQAGASDRGRDFASKHAEAIFAVHPTVDRMRQYSDDLNDRLQNRFQRPAGSVKLIYGLQCIVGESHEHAKEKYEQILSNIPLEGALAWISGHFGPDFSTYDLDEYVQDIEIPGIQGLFESIIYAKGGAPITVKEAALYYAMGMGMPVLYGTAAEIADKIEYFVDEGGADGFMLIASYTPGCYEEFVDMVVPELQRRGRYRTEYTGSTLRENLLAY
ncbi:LLM class flavin-dependent oxidoreductase [cf. Phormidesmis sp. LEGE 11477]|uniref:LLM class flavin-dependent oxidoreductase n=1 Tax=cf. Phormidesmis sp. LEGE 11477 TaxID=1828680 RepID=UPI00187EEBE6|nr:LLM class flavin-dependent oxidoreductase [cf. Phormidesmis sp. LEGE 11477]MBE9061395.1 LLM class flavin-dependent oxidoreductase [cf. Phormidesmis sp. LEGE 11477]